MAKTFSREQAAEGFAEAFSLHAANSSILGPAKDKVKILIGEQERLRKEFRSQNPWQRFLRMVSDKLTFEPIIPERLFQELEATRQSKYKIENMITRSESDLGIFGANLPGLHNLYELTYNPYCTDGKPWHARIGIVVGDSSERAIITYGRFDELRYQTSGSALVDFLSIPKRDSLSPVLKLRTGRQMGVNVVTGVGEDGNNNISRMLWNLEATRKALIVDPGSFREISSLDRSGQELAV